MRQFDVHANPSVRSRLHVPYFVILQSHLIATTNLTIVAPIVPQDGRSAFTLISVTIQLGSDEFVAMVGEVTSIDTHHLGRPVGNLRAYEDDIRRALDRLFTGF